MTVGELRRLLNALPLEAEKRMVMFLDQDSGDVYDFAEVEDRPDREAVWLRGALL